jgi:hypothetical protein
MSFSMVFDGPECPHFGTYLKQMPGDSLCMSKEKATRAGSNDEDDSVLLRSRTGACSFFLNDARESGFILATGSS